MKNLGSIVKESNRDVYTVYADNTVQETVLYMTERNIGAVTIIDGERVVGLFSERDLMRRVIAEGRYPKSVSVRDVMTTDLTIATPEDSCEEGISKMRKAKCRHIPVLEDAKFLGLVSLRDLLEVDADEKADEIRMLNTYIHYVPPDFARGAS